MGFCEIGLEKKTGGYDHYPQRLLRKNFPGVPVYGDIKGITAERLIRDGIRPQIITAGWPCQDISLAGSGAGLEGERSGLWSHVVRLVREFDEAGEPVEFLLLENVSALLVRGVGDVLGDLASLGRDAEWSCIPAGALGAPHRRDRIWILAYPDAGHDFRSSKSLRARRDAAYRSRETDHSDADRVGSPRPGRGELQAALGPRQFRETDHSDADVGRRESEWVEEHDGIEGSSGREPDGLRSGGRRGGPEGSVCDAVGSGLEGLPGDVIRDDEPRRDDPRKDRFIAEAGICRIGRDPTRVAGWWQQDPSFVESALGRVAYGVPNRIQRLKLLGNSIVAPMAFLLGEMILERIDVGADHAGGSQ